MAEIRVSRTEGKSVGLETVEAHHLLTNGLASNMHENFLQLNGQNIHVLIDNGKTLSWEFSFKDNILYSMFMLDCEHSTTEKYREKSQYST